MSIWVNHLVNRLIFDNYYFTQTIRAFGDRNNILYNLLFKILKIFYIHTGTSKIYLFTEVLCTQSINV